MFNYTNDVNENHDDFLSESDKSDLIALAYVLGIEGADKLVKVDDMPQKSDLEISVD